jgi:hypothetical protein
MSPRWWIPALVAVVLLLGLILFVFFGTGAVSNIVQSGPVGP